MIEREDTQNGQPENPRIIEGVSSHEIAISLETIRSTRETLNALQAKLNLMKKALELMRDPETQQETTSNIADVLRPIVSAVASLTGLRELVQKKADECQELINKVWEALDELPGRPEVLPPTSESSPVDPSVN